jgi:hypothetical protein
MSHSSPAQHCPTLCPAGPPVSGSAGTRPGDPEAAGASVPQGDAAGGAVLPAGTEAAQPDPPRCGEATLGHKGWREGGPLTSPACDPLSPCSHQGMRARPGCSSWSGTSQVGHTIGLGSQQSWGVSVFTPLSLSHWACSSCGSWRGQACVQARTSFCLTPLLWSPFPPLLFSSLPHHAYLISPSDIHFAFLVPFPLFPCLSLHLTPHLSAHLLLSLSLSLSLSLKCLFGSTGV